MPSTSVVDRGRLVAGRRIRLVELERRAFERTNLDSSSVSSASVRCCSDMGGGTGPWGQRTILTGCGIEDRAGLRRVLGSRAGRFGCDGVALWAQSRGIRSRRPDCRNEPGFCRLRAAFRLSSGGLADSVVVRSVAPECLFFQAKNSLRAALASEKRARIRYNAKLRSVAAARSESAFCVGRRWSGRSRSSRPSSHYCCQPIMSLFAAVELAPRDPILGLNEAFNADTRTDQGQSRRRRVLRRRRQAAAAARRARSRKSSRRSCAAARLSADRRHRRLRRGRAEAAVRRRLAADRSGPRRDRAGLGGTGALKIGADFLKRLQPERQGRDQRPELGKPPRAVRRRRLRGRELPVLRRGHPRRELRRHARRRCNGSPAGTDRRAARLLPQPDRRRPDRRRNGSRSSEAVKAHRPRAVPRHGLPGLRRRHRRGRRRRAPVR